MIGFWFLIILVAVAILCVGWIFERPGLIIASVLLLVLLGGASWYLNATEPGQRLQKSWQSETGDGLQRTITVYDVQGDIIKTYTGKFDVDYDANRIIFDDGHGKRHMIYYTTGTVTIDEN